MIKRVPLRMCIACRQMLPKSKLIRIVKSDKGIYLDYSSRAAGRGAYVCNTADCINKCVKTKALSRAFGEAIDPAVYENIRKQYESQNS